MERRDFLGCAALATIGAATAAAQTTSPTAAKPAEPKPAPEVKGLRITVLKHGVQPDFQKIRGEEIKPCTAVRDGQEFVIEKPWIKPEGMCDWAWGDMRPSLPYVFSGMWGKQTVVCCTDGFRPVFFKIEQIT